MDYLLPARVSHPISFLGFKKVVPAFTSTFGYRSLLKIFIMGWLLFVCQPGFGQITWTDRTYYTLNAVTAGPNLFVAVGDNGTIKTSTDGVSWTRQTSGTSVRLLGITFGHQRYVAVGENGTIITSPDGVNWTPQPSGTTKILYNILFAQEQFVTVGQTGTILTSPDGLSWTAQSSGTTNQLSEIIYGNNQYVAAYIAGQIVTSPDGITWTPRSIPAIPSFGLAYGNGLYISSNAFGGILSSPDATSYTLRSQGDGAFYSVIYSNGLFVAVGNSGQLKTSPDGITWTSRTSLATATLNSVTYGNGLYVAVGIDGVITTSPDGITWIRRSLGDVNGLNDVAYGNGQFIAVGGRGTIRSSSDGINWNVLSLGLTASSINGIAFGKGIFILTYGGDPEVYGSTDGLTWVRRNKPPRTPYNVRFANDRFFAVGENGLITTSIDSFDWPVLNSGTISLLQSAAYGNGVYITAGLKVLRSTNGINWTTISSVSESIFDITFGNGLFVAVGNLNESSGMIKGSIVTSPDGLTWTRRSIGTISSNLEAITYANNTFVVVGRNGVVLTSPDGITWNRQNSGTTEGLNGVTYGNGLFVAVGGPGTIITSPIEPASPVVTGFTASPATVCAGQPVSFSATIGTLTGTYAYTLSNGSNPVSGTVTSATYSQTLLTQGSGTPSYTLTVTADGQTRSVSQAVTVNSCTVVGPLTLIQPLYNCETGLFTFQSVGGDGSEVSYMAVGITGWTTTKGAFRVVPYCDVDPFTLYARQASDLLTNISYRWNYTATCPVNCSTTVPPSTTSPIGCNSPISSQGHSLSLLAPIYNCQSGEIIFKPNGGNGSPIEFMSIGITGWTTNCVNRIDSPDLISDILNPSSQVAPFTIFARQRNPDDTYTMAQFRWDAKATCNGNGRESTSMDNNPLQVTVLGNPTLADVVEVCIQGAGGTQTKLQLMNAQGQLVSERIIQQATVDELTSISLGRSSGIYMLRVSTPTKYKNVKIIRQ